MFKPKIENLIIYPSKIAIGEEDKTKLIAESSSVFYQKSIGSVGDVEIRLLFNSSRDIPVMATPVDISTDRKKVIIVDARPFVGKISGDNRFENTIDYTVKNLPELNQQVIMAILMATWEDGSETILNNTTFAMEALGKLIAGSVTSRLGLDVVTASEIEVYAGLLYVSNSVRDKKKLKDAMYLATKIKRITSIPTEKIISLITKDGKTLPELGMCNTPRTFAEAVKAMNNPRLAKFEFATLLNLLSNLSSFYSYDVKIMASLEYPPAWIPLVYGALTDKRHKRSYLATRIDTIKTRNRNVEAFEDYVERLFELVEYDKEIGK